MKIQGLAAATAVCFVLVACGGGGGGSSAPSISPAPIVQPSTIETTVPPSTYGVATAQRDAFDFLNSQRVACGFGALQQSAQIDAAAQAHSDYMKVNFLARTHFEDNTNYPTGFTGVTPDVRIKAAGYPAASGAGSEAIADASLSSYGTAIGRAAMMNLMLAPYHGFMLFNGDRDVGVGYNTATTEIVVNLAFSDARPKQLLASDAVATYPCASTTGVLTKSYYDESPSPISSRNLASAPIGHPIYVKVRDGQTLSLSSVDVRKQGAASPVAVTTLTKANDANNYVGNNGAIVIPTAPLDANSTYQVKVTGTNTTSSGTPQPFDLSFTFATGAN
jgi:uncharacterized protein YkwD